MVKIFNNNVVKGNEIVNDNGSALLHEEKG